MSVVGPRRLQHLLDAVVATGAGLDLAETLHRITELATDLVDARYGALGVLDPTRTKLSQFITVGIDEDGRKAIGHLPDGHGILGLLILDAKPLRLPDLTEHPDSFGFPPNHPEMRSFLGVPILVRGAVFGNLYLTEKTTDEVFTDVDEELVVGLAAAAGVAIENARLHAAVADLALTADRERIARDLHDLVIQRLFAIGLSLQGTTQLVDRDPATAAARIESAIDDLDETVKTIRTAIFSLESTTRRSPEGLRDRILALCREAAGALGFAPRVIFDGAVDIAASDTVEADLVATLQEALSNVARHARATEVLVELAVEDAEVALTVTDDGGGPTEPTSGSGRGLKNMAERARSHGGDFDLSTGSAGGAVLRWRAPRGVD